MDGGILLLAAIVAVGSIALFVLLGRVERKDVPGGERVRRGTGNAMLGLQEFIEPSVEYVFQAQNVEQKDQEEDEGFGNDEEVIRSDLTEALSRTPVDLEEVRRHLSAAARAGMDWDALFESTTDAELRKRPYRAPSIPPLWRVAPRE
jgi:hypothetical protein